jgi:hypothetical protein
VSTRGGSRPTCKHCGNPIVWKQDPKTAKWIPTNPEGTDHRESCGGLPGSAKAKIRDRNHEGRVTEFLATPPTGRDGTKRSASPAKAVKAAMAALVAEARSRPVQLRNEALPEGELPPPWETA